MSREIEFRGISYKNNKFVCGWLLQNKYNTSKYFIRTFPNEDDDYDDVVVNINTVGQYTGIKDKNGVKIFEGDIVKFNGELYKVIWDNDECRFSLANSVENTFLLLTSWRMKRLEVIGNIYENPDLLGDNNE